VLAQVCAFVIESVNRQERIWKGAWDNIRIKERCGVFVQLLLQWKSN